MANTYKTVVRNEEQISVCDSNLSKSDLFLLVEVPE